MKVSVGSRLFGRHRTYGKVTCATVAEVFVDDDENFFLVVPKKFSDSTQNVLYLDRALSQPLLVERTGDVPNVQVGKSGFIPVKISKDQELDTSTFEFTDLTPSSLSTVTSQRFGGFVASTPMKIPGIIATVASVLVEFMPNENKTPIIGDLCLTNSLAWGAVVAIGDKEPLAVVVPFSEIYREFKGLKLNVAPSSEIERRRRRQESDSTKQSTEVMAVFELVDQLFKETGAPSDRAFAKYSFDDLGYKLQRVGKKFDVHSVISGLPSAFGYHKSEKVPLKNLLAPGQLVSNIFFHWQESQLVYDPEGIESDRMISLAKIVAEALSELSEVA